MMLRAQVAVRFVVFGPVAAGPFEDAMAMSNFSHPGEAMRRSGPLLLLAAIVLAMLGGCGRYYWTQAGSTAEQFARDSRECVQQAKSTPPGPVSSLAADLIEQRYRTCLAGRGYLREKQLDPPAAGSYRGIESEEELAAGAPAKP